MVLLTAPIVRTMKKPFSTSWIPATWPTSSGKSSLSDARDPADFLGILEALSAIGLQSHIIAKFSTSYGPSCQVSFFGQSGRKEINEFSKIKKPP